MLYRLFDSTYMQFQEHIAQYHPHLLYRMRDAHVPVMGDPSLSQRPSQNLQTRDPGTYAPRQTDHAATNTHGGAVVAWDPDSVDVHSCQSRPVVP